MLPRVLMLLVLISSLQPGNLQSVQPTQDEENNADLAEVFDEIKTLLSTIKSKTTTHIREFRSFKNQMEDDFRILREDLTSLNVSVSNLSMQQQKFEEQTTAELSQIQTTLNTTQTFLATHTQQVNAKLNLLTTDLSQHRKKTAAELANISNLECTDTEESLQLHQSILNNLTHQLQTILRIHMNETEVLYSCGGTEGWRRVVYLDMTDPSTTCPSGWNMTGYSKRTCGRGYNTCGSVTFPVSGGEYSKVCGRIKAYQWGSPDAFWRYHQGYATTIDSPYVDGVIIAHGSPLQHVWTFAAGLAEGSPSQDYVCPCDADHTIRVPQFVGNDYFCESGVNELWNHDRYNDILQSFDTLWDGENCLSNSTCCSLHNPPYFVRQLSTPTTDDIEARICLDKSSSSENIAVELVELYVQ